MKIELKRLNDYIIFGQIMIVVNHLKFVWILYLLEWF